MSVRLRFDFEGRTLQFAAPRRVIRADTLAEVPAALAAVEDAALGGCWAAGFVAYDAAPAFDPALAVQGGAGVPLLWFGVFDGPADIISPPAASAAGDGTPRFEPDTARTVYDAAVAAIRAGIGAGDFYQVNYTMRLRGPAAGLAGEYARLLRAQEAGYAADIDTGVLRILSVSPELFFRRRGHRIETRPMKGTAWRGRWLEEDEAAAARLLASEKERAENLMIVDLMRNDLGRVARFGSVHVPRLFDVERYPTVHQLTSTVAATLRPGTRLTELFHALFPSGSVTGAPKVAAMRAIAGLEQAPRGVYCGTIGVVEPGGDCTFNVAIRTLVLHANGRAEYGVGGGITWDSSPGAEHAEALSKAVVLAERRPEFALLETMRLDADGILRIDGHLARLLASARYFGFALDAVQTRASLLRHAAAQLRSLVPPVRLRVTVGRDGGMNVTATPVEPSRAAPLVAALATRPVDSRDVFLYHKTTNRSVYERRRLDAPSADEVLLYNERGELTEFTTGNLVLELDGGRVTPARTCGLLAGVFRDELLAAGRVAERILTAADLRVARGCWLVNSVREWVPVTVATPPPVVGGAQIAEIR